VIDRVWAQITQELPRQWLQRGKPEMVNQVGLWAEYPCVPSRRCRVFLDSIAEASCQGDAAGGMAERPTSRERILVLALLR